MVESYTCFKDELRNCINILIQKSQLGIEDEEVKKILDKLKDLSYALE